MSVKILSQGVYENHDRDRSGRIDSGEFEQGNPCEGR